LQDGTSNQPWTSQSEIIHPLLLDQWQTITFDFLNDPFINAPQSAGPPTQRTDFNRVLIQINGENNADGVVAYIDDFSYDGTVLADPDFSHLVWADEFDVDGAVDTSKWFHQTQLPNGVSWFNNEIQHYTNRIDNAEVSNGNLSIVAKRETFTDQGQTKQFTSARLNSKFAFEQGRVEVRAKLPTGVGTWPAIWMLGKNIIEPGAYWDNQGFGQVFWPACGEIDIMEHWGNNQNFVQSAMHTPSSFGNTVNHGGQIIPTASTDFHVYELEWTETKMVFSVDGVVHYTYSPPVRDANTWPFDGEQFILLNIAIEPTIGANFTQSAMEIDYVRVYQESPLSLPNNKEGLALKYFPNPVANQFTVQFEKPIFQPITFEIYQIDGKLVKSETVVSSGSQVTLQDLGDLQSGVYVLVFELENQTYRTKMIKE
jgi:beta-glucanase (GH16 family)